MVGAKASNRSKGAGHPMIAIAAIAIAAGSASALMYASTISRVRLSLVLIYLAPLPLMVAAIGWGPLTGAMGGIAAASALGLPVAKLAHAGNGAAPPAPAMEWYPTGRLLLWISGFAVLITMAALLTIGGDAAEISATMKRNMLAILKAGGLEASADMDRAGDFFVAIVPTFAAIFFVKMLAVNLWLAAKITATSGRLNRPWPDIRSTALPP